jgi:hypothetical protein
VILTGDIAETKAVTRSKIVLCLFKGGKAHMEKNGR